MIRSPAAAGRKFAGFSIVVLALVWCMIGVDLWHASGHGTVGIPLLPEEASLAGVASCKLLVLVLGMLLTGLVAQAWRQFAGIDSHLSLQRLIADHASEA